jgi:hypothetical protein
MNISFSEPQDSGYGDISNIMLDDRVIGELNLDKGLFGLYDKYDTPALREKTRRAIDAKFPGVL